MKKFESIYIEGLESYINENLIPRPFSIFKEMEEFALKNRIPIIAPASGAILQFLVSTLKPKKILELGTGLGYSTAWMLSSNLPLEIKTLDRNARELKSAEFFLKQVMSDSQKVFFTETHCLEYLKNSNDLDLYDFIFVDCDKICYPEILEISLKNIKPNTFLLFDNVLWHGRLDEAVYTKPSDRAIQNFWHILRENSVKYTLFPSGDGLLLIS